MNARRHASIYLTLACGAVAATTWAATFYVSPSGSHTPPFDSWVNAATDIQSAASTTTDGDTVLVTNGTYFLWIPILITNGIDVRSVQGAAVTIIDAIPTTSAYVKVMHASAVLNGFTIKNSSFPGISVNSGTVMNCSIQSNHSAKCGGAHIESGAIINCLVEWNSATNWWGGGILASNGLIRNCLIRHNSASVRHNGYGGGVSLSSSRMENCVVTSNSAWDVGGIELFMGSNSLNNCTVAGNTAVSHVTLGSPIGGIGWYSTNARIFNVIAYGNSVSNVGAEFGGSSPVSITFSCVDYPGLGNFFTNPLFADISADNYHLASNSPCIDAGDPTNFPATDLDGVARPLDGNYDGTARADVGAYEFVHPLADTDGDGLIDTNEVYTHLSSPVSQDTDGDHFPDGHEIQAGSGILDPASYLGLFDTALGGEAGPIIRWQSASNKTYTLLGSTNLDFGFSRTVATDIASTPPMNTFTDPAPGSADASFYGVRLQP